MDEFKRRIQNALDRHSSRQIKTPKRKKHNGKPEAILALDIKKTLNEWGWSVDIVESKAVYSEAAGAYLHGKTRPGFSDIVGNDCNGFAVYIEVKAKGKRSTVRPDQYKFLTEKINTNAFAIVADSIEYISNAHDVWSTSRDKNFLLDELPKLQPRWAERDKDPVFDIE